MFPEVIYFSQIPTQRKCINGLIKLFGSNNGNPIKDVFYARYQFKTNARTSKYHSRSFFNTLQDGKVVEWKSCINCCKRNLAIFATFSSSDKLFSDLSWHLITATFNLDFFLVHFFATKCENDHLYSFHAYLVSISYLRDNKNLVQLKLINHDISDVGWSHTFPPGKVCWKKYWGDEYWLNQLRKAFW